MKKQNQGRKQLPTKKRNRFFRIAILAGVFVALAAVTVIAKYVAPRNSAAPSKQNSADDGFVTVNVAGKKIRVNARTMQQGPLTQEQSQQIADALEENKSTAGLVEVRHADGTIEMNLQGRFQDVVVAKKNDDGSVSTSCVDNAEAARGFLNSTNTTTDANPNRKAISKQ